MKKLSCLLLLTWSVAYSQSVIKKDLFYLFNKIPLLPASSKEAYGKGIPEGSAGEAEGKYSFEVERFNPFFAETQKFSTEAARLSVPTMAGVDNPEELAKKMEKMSEAEKMKMAMEMMKGMQARPRAIHESPEVMNAFREFGQLNELLSQEQNNDLQYQLNDRFGPLNKKFSEMDERIHKMVCLKFPSYCEDMGLSSFTEQRRAADNAGAFKMLQENWNEKNKLFEKESIVLRDDQEKRATLWKKRLGPFNDALRKANFGAEVKDQAIIQAFSNGQQRIIAGVEELASSSKQVWAFAAALYAQEVQLEKRMAEIKKN